MKKALVIGINNYPTKPLKAPVNDANSVGKLLKQHADGSPNFDTIIEINVPTKSALRGMIINHFESDPDVNTAILYFAGHGYLDELGGYIVTPDHETNDVGISMNDILDLANQSSIRNKIIILDCCHSGVFGAQSKGGSITPISSGISILTACKAEESAIGINGHGVFTNLLISALEGGAADLRGHISPGGIYAYIDQALGALDQRPVFKTNVTRFVSLREVKPQVSADIIRKLIEYFPTQEDAFNLDPSYEETNADSVPHSVIEPHSNPENVAIFKHLQKFQSVGLIVPIEEDYMYFAAMKSKSCKLTALGCHYWRLVKDSRF